MKINETFFRNLCKLYWLKPADVCFDHEVLAHVDTYRPRNGTYLDIGCGDGIVSGLLMGGEIGDDYDRYSEIEGRYQTIGPNQSSDLFENKITGTPLSNLERQIDLGFDPKEYHLRAARSTGAYAQVRQSTCESFSEGRKFSFAFAIFALYWVDNLEAAVNSIAKSLDDDGMFVTVMPSEFNTHMHIADVLANHYKQLPLEAAAGWFSEMAGERKYFLNRHAGTAAHWKEYFRKFGLNLINVHPVLSYRRYVTQDGFQRGMFPHFLRCSKVVKTAAERKEFVRTFTRPVAESIFEETNKLEGKEPPAYYVLAFRKAR
jgi:SAM-dependent methyltransferase